MNNNKKIIFIKIKTGKTLVRLYKGLNKRLVKENRVEPL